MIEGTAFSGDEFEFMYRRQMLQSGRYYFDDDAVGLDAFLGGPVKQIDKTGNYTVTTADRGAILTNTGATGAVIFTLPAIVGGLMFEFYVVADQNVTIASAEGDNMVVFNDAAADSVAFSTASEKIGGNVIVHSNPAGTLWLVRNNSTGNTITVAT